MSWITPFEMNMDITRNVYEEPSDYLLIDLAKKVALYSVIPLTMIAAFEAIFKNVLFVNLANFGVAILNAGHDLYFYLANKFI